MIIYTFKPNCTLKATCIIMHNTHMRITLNKEPHKKYFLWHQGMHWNKHDTFSWKPPWNQGAFLVRCLCSLGVSLLLGYIWGTSRVQVKYQKQRDTHALKLEPGSKPLTPHLTPPSQTQDIWFCVNQLISESVLLMSFYEMLRWGCCVFFFLALVPCVIPCTLIWPLPAFFVRLSADKVV